MAEFASSLEFCSLRGLAKQLDICGKNTKLHVPCVLLINDIGHDCRELYNPLISCIEKSEADKSSESLLSAVLSQLAKRAEESLFKSLSGHAGRLDNLRAWATIMKVLHDLYTVYPEAWSQSDVLPKQGRARMQKVLQGLKENDSVRRLLMHDTPELVGFFEPLTANDLYLESIEKVIYDLRDTKYEYHERDVRSIVSTKPNGFKFPTSIVQKLIKFEDFMLSCDQVDEPLIQFYTLLFFMYEHASDPVEICRVYSTLGTSKDKKQLMRNQSFQLPYISFCAKIMDGVFRQRRDQVAYLFYWLSIIDPKSPLVVMNAEFFEGLPNLPPKELSKEEGLPNLPPKELSKEKSDAVPSSSMSIQRDRKDSKTPETPDTRNKLDLNVPSIAAPNSQKIRPMHEKSADIKTFEDYGGTIDNRSQPSGMMQTGFARRGHVAPTKWDFSSNRMEDVEAAAINGFRSNGKRYGDSFSWRNVGRTDPPEVFGGLRNLVNISGKRSTRYT